MRRLSKADDASATSAAAAPDFVVNNAWIAGISSGSEPQGEPRPPGVMKQLPPIQPLVTENILEDPGPPQAEQGRLQLLQPWRMG